MSNVSPRGLLGWLLLSAMAAGAFEADYLRVAGPASRESTRDTLVKLTDEPGYVEFLEAVEARTPAGSTIAILSPRKWGGGGYEYAYYRAVYVIDSRTILPAIWTDSAPLRDNLRSADYLAAWKTRIDSTDRELVWEGLGGRLYRTSSTR